jgi:hypothetical protein
VDSVSPHPQKVKKKNYWKSEHQLIVCMVDGRGDQGGRYLYLLKTFWRSFHMVRYFLNFFIDSNSFPFFRNDEFQWNWNFIGTGNRERNKRRRIWPLWTAWQRFQAQALQSLITLISYCDSILYSCVCILHSLRFHTETHVASYVQELTHTLRIEQESISKLGNCLLFHFARG